MTVLTTNTHTTATATATMDTSALVCPITGRTAPPPPRRPR